MKDHTPQQQHLVCEFLANNRSQQGGKAFRTLLFCMEILVSLYSRRICSCSPRKKSLLTARGHEPGTYHIISCSGRGKN